MAHSKLYVKLMNSKAWRDLRALKLQTNPLCESCQQKGLVVAACCVHHKVPVESGRTEDDCIRLCYQWSNLQALCYECHADIHKADRSHSKEAHQKRSKDRLQQWIERHNNGGTPAP